MILKDKGRMEESVSDQTQRLIVKDATLADAGEYRLRVTNPSGFAETSIVVEISGDFLIV